MIDPYIIASGVASVAAVVGWGKVKALRGEYKLLEAINKGVRLCNDDLRGVADELEFQLFLARAELCSAKALIAKRTERYRAGQAKSTASKAKARAEKVAKTLADLPAALAPMDVAA